MKYKEIKATVDLFAAKYNTTVTERLCSSRKYICHETFSLCLLTHKKGLLLQGELQWKFDQTQLHTIVACLLTKIYIENGFKLAIVPTDDLDGFRVMNKVNRKLSQIKNELLEKMAHDVYVGLYPPSVLTDWLQENGYENI